MLDIMTNKDKKENFYLKAEIQKNKIVWKKI